MMSVKDRLTLAYFMQKDTNGKVKVVPELIKRDENGNVIDFTLDVEDGFDYAQYLEDLKKI